MESRVKNYINLIAAFVAFSTNVIINFFITPFIVERVGVAAYGYVAMANDFVAYISLITLALNTMSSRFITIAIHKNDRILANEYYSSIIGSNVFVSIFLFISSTPIILFLDNIIKIPADLILDVKLLFFVSTVNFLLTVLLSTYAVCYIIRNELYLSSLVQIKGNLLRLILLLILFGFFNAHVFYIAIGTLVSTILVKVYDVFYQKKLVPELQFSLRNFHWDKCKIVLSSGIWSSVTRLGNILSGNLDLLLVNVFLSPVDMGLLAITKIAPNFLTTFTGIMAGVCMPTFLELFARGEHDMLVDNIISSMKTFSLILGIPLIILISLGKQFFALWIPQQDSMQLYILSILSLIAIIIIGPVALMHNIFTVVNRLKVNSLLVVFTGLLNTFFGVLILKNTDWGIYGLVSLAAGLSLMRNLLYTVPVGALYLGKPVKTFFPVLLQSSLTVIISGFILHLIFSLIDISTWPQFFGYAIISMIALIITQLVFLFSRQERNVLLHSVSNKVQKVFRQ